MSRFGDLVSGKEVTPEPAAPSAPAAPEPAAVPSKSAEPIIQPKLSDNKRKNKKAK